MRVKLLIEPSLPPYGLIILHNSFKCKTKQENKMWWKYLKVKLKKKNTNKLEILILPRIFFKKLRLEYFPLTMTDLLVKFFYSVYVLIKFLFHKN